MERQQLSGDSLKHRTWLRYLSCRDTAASIVTCSSIFFVDVFFTWCSVCFIYLLDTADGRTTRESYENKTLYYGVEKFTKLYVEDFFQTLNESNVLKNMPDFKHLSRSIDFTGTTYMFKVGQLIGGERGLALAICVSQITATIFFPISSILVTKELILWGAEHPKLPLALRVEGVEHSSGSGPLPDSR